MTHTRLLVLILIAAAVSGCHNAKFDREYPLSHSGKQISIRFENAPFDVQVSAYLNTRSCRSITISNKGGAPVTLDLLVYNLAKANSSSDLSTELKVMVRESPDAADAANIFPLGSNVRVIGTWFLKRVQVQPGGSSKNCVDGFPDLGSGDHRLSVEWLENPG